MVNKAKSTILKKIKFKKKKMDIQLLLRALRTYRDVCRKNADMKMIKKINRQIEELIQME